MEIQFNKKQNEQETPILAILNQIMKMMKLLRSRKKPKLIQHKKQHKKQQTLKQKKFMSERLLNLDTRRTLSTYNTEIRNLLY